MAKIAPGKIPPLLVCELLRYGYAVLKCIFSVYILVFAFLFVTVYKLFS